MVALPSSARGAARLALVVSLGGIAVAALVAPSTPNASAPLTALFPPGDTTTVYGPTQLSTPNGNPTNHVNRFAVAVTPGKRYTLRLVNGAPNGSAKVTSGTVRLNGWETVTGGDLASGATLERVVQLRTEDTLFATVQGPAGAYVTVSVLATPDPSFLVFGVERFIRNTGTPVTDTRQFTVSPTAAAPFRLCIINGNTDGSQRISSAQIFINGIEVLTQNELNQHVASLSKVVSLQPGNNVMTVTLTAQPQGFLDLCVTATDVTPPVLTINAPPPNLITRDTLVTVTGTVQDETPTAVTVNGQAAQVTGGGFSKVTALPFEGHNTIHIVATDAAGHVTDSTRTVIRDRTAPVLAVNSPADGLITRDTIVAVSGTVLDSTTVTVNVNGVSLSVGQGGAFSGTLALVEGHNSLVITATDVVGNVTSVPRTVIRDRIGPVLTVNGPAQGLITRDTIIIVSVTATDSNAVTVNVNGIQLTAGQNGAFSGSIALIEGHNTLTITAVDAAGNQTPATRTVIRDRIPPALIVSAPADGFITKQTSVVVSGTVMDSTVVTVTADGISLTVGQGGGFSGSVPLIEGHNTLVIIARDAAGNETPATRTVISDTQVPVIVVSQPPEGDTVTTPSVNVVGTVTDSTAVVLTVNGDTVPLGQGGSFTKSVALVIGANTITVVATDQATNVATLNRHVVRKNPLPPDPATVATAINPVEATLIKENTSFLYTGTSPIQTGVDTAAIKFLRAAVVRGRVLDRQLQPLGGAVVKIKSHSEFGQTLSRADGGYDLVVNGGGSLVLDFSKGGYLPAQRTVEVPWQDYTPVEDVILVQPDPVVTVVDLTASGITVARGSVQTDADGARQATVFFEEGTKAALKHPNGTIDTLTTLNVRATEFTVGENGEAAMPGQLPPSSQYTYAVQVTADQQIGEPGATLTFTKPVPIYVENFLDLDSLKTVPVGVYNPDSAKWLPRPNGLMVKVTGTNAQGQALLDINGDGIADSDSLLLFNGIDPVERVKLAGTYPLNSRLWRVPIIEALPHDLNWPFTLLGGTEPKTLVTGPCGSPGADVLRCSLQVQTAFQTVGLVGSPFTLSYASDRTRGNVAERTLDIQLVGAIVPAFLERVDLEVTVAGRLFEASFTPTANLTYHFVWDGKDAYGRTVQATQPATVRVGYLYPVVYSKPASGSQSFGAPCNVSTGSCTVAAVPPAETDIRALRRIWEGTQTTLGGIDAAGLGIGGFTLDVQHAYDPVGGILYSGNGTRRVAATLPDQITRWAGNGNSGGATPPVVNGKHRLEAQIDNPAGIVVATDGSVILSEPFRGRVLKISTIDTISTLAGLPTGPIADSGTATALRVLGPQGIALGPDGSVYFAEQNGHRIRQVTPQGFMRTIAGDGTCAFAGDTGLAKAARICQPTGLGIAPDGSIYFADQGNLRIRRIGPDRRISTVAGFGTVQQCFLAGSGTWPPPPPQDFITICKDGSPASQAPLRLIQALTVGPDGSVYFSQGPGGKFDGRIRRIDPSGIIRTVVGSDHGSPPVPLTVGDGGSALQARLQSAWAIAIGPDGSIYFSDELGELVVNGVPQPGTGLNRVRRVRPDGLIQTVVGDGVAGNTGDNGPARRARIQRVEGIAFLADGSILISDDAKVRKVSPPLPGLAGGQTVIASPDGSELYVFSAAGRALVSLDAVTRDTLYRFTYDSQRRLIAIRDPGRRITTIERDAQGRATAVVSPDGIRTVVGVDGNGNLASLTDPGSPPTVFNATADGLLQLVTDANGDADFVASYDAMGRLASVSGDQPLTASESGGEVTFSTPQGVDARISATTLPNGDVRQQAVLPNGALAVVTIAASDGSVTSQFPFGTTSTLSSRPDPAFGVSSPLEEQTITTPSGLRYTRRVGRALVLSDTLNPASVIRRTDSLIVNGAASTEVYERATQLVTRTSAAGRKIFLSSMDGGRIRGIRVQGLDSLLYQFDAQGRMTNSIQGQRSKHYTYSSAGFITSVADALGGSVRFDYDSAGLPLRQIGRGGDTIAYSYDAAGNATAITPPGKPAHHFTFNSNGGITSYAPPAAADGPALTTFAYDTDNRLIRIARPGEPALVISYDSAGRRDTIRVPTGTYRYQYDPTGNLTRVDAPSGVVSQYTFDGHLHTGQSWSGPVLGSVTRTFNNELHVASQRINSEPAVTFQYDLDGLLTNAGALVFTRSPTSGAITATQVGSVTTTVTYNNYGEADSYSASINSSPVFQVALVRDVAGRVTRRTETVQGVGHTLDFSYDAAGHLASMQNDGVVAISYEYDGNGNRTRAVNSNGSTVGVYDVRDRLVSNGSTEYRYTLAGELASKISGSDTTRYQPDAFGNLLAVTLPNGTSITYVADGENRRVGRRVNGVMMRGYLYGFGTAIAAELDGQGTIISRFVYGERPNVPEYMIRDGQTYRLISDLSGSVRLVVNTSTGAIAQRLDYDPYGQLILDSNAGFQPFGYKGGLYDAETGLVRLGARDYDPATGRWVTPDRTLFAGGATNLYAFASSDPVNYTDFTGQFSLLEEVVSFGIQTVLDGIKYGAGQVGIPTGPGSAFGLGMRLLSTSIALARFAHSKEVKAAQRSIETVNELLDIWSGDVNSPNIENVIAEAMEYNHLLVAAVGRKGVWLAIGRSTSILDGLAPGASVVAKCVLGAAFDTQVSFEVITAFDETPSKIVNTCIGDPLRKGIQKGINNAAYGPN
jgi:RHS repeat-associated protein